MKIVLTAKNIGLDGTYLTWELDLAVGEVLNLIEFNVEVGEGKEGPWKQVNDYPISNAFGYIDRNSYQSSFNERTAYRINALNLANNQETASNVVYTVEHMVSQVGRYITKQQRLMLRRYNGSPTLHYARRHFGERCQCYDKLSGKQLVLNCPICFNTTFVGGYYYPTLIYMTRNPNPKTAHATAFGPQEMPTSGVWTSNNAIIEANDILVSQQEHGYRYIVRQVNPTQLQDATLRQRLVIEKLRPDDGGFLIPVPDDPIDLETESVFRRYWSVR